jgi:hypothetical protein
MQFKIEIVFLKERFFVIFFFGREPIRLILKKCLAYRSQMQILNTRG